MNEAELKRMVAAAVAAEREACAAACEETKNLDADVLGFVLNGETHPAVVAAGKIAINTARNALDDAARKIRNRSNAS